MRFLLLIYVCNSLVLPPPAEVAVATGAIGEQNSKQEREQAGCILQDHSKTILKQPSEKKIWQIDLKFFHSFIKNNKQKLQTEESTFG